MNYIGKEVTNLVSVCKVGGSVYYNLDFIGNFKATEMKIKPSENNREAYLYVVDGKVKNEITNDPIKLMEESNVRFRGLGKTVMLLSPVHIKRSYTRYKWLDENGFIGPDDTLILRNRNQHSFYKDCITFFDEASECIKAEEYKDRTVVYKFHKYGLDGKIKKHKDGQGEIKFEIPGGENKISFEYYVNGIAHTPRITNYKTKELTEDEKYRLNELNKIVVGLGLKEIIDKS